MNDNYINVDLVYNLIKNQFPEYSHLEIKSVEKQGHDNRTYKIGDDLLIRMPTAESYAIKVPKGGCLQSPPFFRFLQTRSSLMEPKLPFISL